MNDTQIGIHCDCTRGCGKCGVRIAREEVKTVSCELIVGSVERNEESGEVRINRFVRFSSSDGSSLLCPWEDLKRIVGEWERIERGG